MRRHFAIALLAIVLASTRSQAEQADPTSQTTSSAHDEAIAPSSLTPAEQAMLREGEFSGASHVGGIVAAATIGLGTGQLVQGRWLKRGWIFTVGEMASVVLFGLAASENDLDPTLVNVVGFSGVVGFIGFHAWEIADAAIVPARHNRRVRFLRARVGLPTVSLDVRPLGERRDARRGAVVGLRINF